MLVEEALYPECLQLYITLIGSTLFLFLRLARCLLTGGIAQSLRQSPRTHTPTSVTTTVAEVLLQSWRSREGFVSLLGGDWTHSLVHARHYHWAHLHISLCYVGSSDPPVPASWVSGTSGVCCHTPSQVVLISAIYEVEFYTGFRTISNLFLRLLY